MLHRKRIFLGSIIAVITIFSGCGGESDKTAPQFTSSEHNIIVIEGQRSVTTVKAADKNSVTYAVHGGADAALFAIDSQTGELSLKEALSWQNAKSADGDRVFEVVVQATDEAGNSAVQQLYIKLVSSDTESPHITTPDRIEVAKNREKIATITADDVSKPLSFSIANGKDVSLFSIDASSGELRFSQNPTYQKNGENTYEVTVEVTDSVGNSATKELTVKVVDAKVVLTTGIPGEPGAPRAWQRNSVDAEHGIVTFQNNTIEWEDSVPNGNLPHRTFSSAKNYCESLELNGHDDWRLPTPNELHQLINHAFVGDTEKYIDDAFKYVILTYYWTSVEIDNENARVVNFVLGSDAEMAKGEDDGNNVRCVRGELSEGEFVKDDQNHTVADLSTGLIWDNSSDIGTDDQKFNHADAAQACKNKGMRLPTINELITLADYENKKIRIPQPAGADALYFWSSTPALYEPNKYRYFSFDKAANEFGSKTLDAPHEIYIRCVKSRK